MMKEKIAQLQKIYNAFDETTLAYKKDTACEKGCGFCCSQAGKIDITTLEGMVIRDAMKKFSRPLQKKVTRFFQKEIKKREDDKIVPCPFLMKNNACMIYKVRPFSCRRIYSTHICNRDKLPMVSRTVMDAAANTIRQLQLLDTNGYSGHLSYVLYMLSVPAFLSTYEKDEFKPEEIMEFGKSHHIIINKMVV